MSARSHVTLEVIIARNERAYLELTITLASWGKVALRLKNNFLLHWVFQFLSDVFLLMYSHRDIWGPLLGKWAEKVVRMVAFHQCGPRLIPGACFPVTFRDREAINYCESITAYFRNMVFQQIYKIQKNNIIAKFQASKPSRSKDTKRFIFPEIRPKSFGTFEKRAPVNYKIFVHSHSDTCTLETENSV